MDGLLRDLRYGLRLLFKNKSFTAIAVLTLALGIGANTAIFQLLNAVRLRALPVAKPQELVEVRITDPTGARGGWSSSYATTTNPMWEQIRDNQQAFSGIFAWGSEPWVNLATGGEARFAQSLWVSGDFFNTLGIRPALGRFFTAADDRRGCSSAGVVISYRFWQREFGGDPSIAGKTVKLDGRPFEIIGVTPAGFFGLEVGRSFDVAIPICAEPLLAGENTKLDAGTEWWLTVVGRLNPGWSIEQANNHLNAISPGVFKASLSSNYPAEDVNKYLEFKLGSRSVATGFSQLRESYEDPLWLLLALAGFVLLIACANLANLMLARASTREREVAVRLALGATRGRLIRQLLAESLLLGVAGALLGALIAGDLSSALVSFISTDGSPLFVSLETDWRVLAFTAGVAFLTCVLFGLTPALRATRITPSEVMKAGGRGLTASRARFGFRRALVVSQVALSMVLLVGAMLFTRSLRNLFSVDAGFQQDGLLFLYVNPSDMKIPAGARQAFKRDLVERVRGVSGVESAAETNIIPMSGSSASNRVWMDGSDAQGGDNCYHSRISPDYFKTLGTQLVAGRDFDDRDTPASPRVAIVNESFVRKFTDGADPIGKRFWKEATPNEPAKQFEIVGLVRDAKYANLRDEMEPVFYFATSQQQRVSAFTQLLIRSNADAAGTFAGVRHAIAEVNPSIVITSGVFTKQLENSLLRERLMAMLSAFFGVLALVLACVGLYGIMSYTVAGRTNEIGIRMALGAEPSNVGWMVLREALALVAMGIAIGLSAALSAAHLVSSLLFGMGAVDPVSIGLATLAMIGVAALATYVPARRATRVDPMVALRCE